MKLRIWRNWLITLLPQNKRLPLGWVVSLALSLLLLFLTSCGQTSPTIEAGEPSPSIQPVVTTSQPSPTPPATPTLQPRALFVSGQAADPQQVTQVEALVSELAGQAGLSFQTLPALSTDALSPDVQVVVAVSPESGLVDLAAASPGTQFVFVGAPDLPGAPNIHQVNLGGVRADQQGFLAGYLAAVVTPDWRVGVISNVDTIDGKANRQGFLNGVVFYCGLCRPAYPPFVQYPLAVELPSGAGLAEQQAAADSLVAQGVTTVYVAPGSADLGFLEYLAQKGVNLIGGETMPPNLADHWIATIHSDWRESLRQAWDAALQGEPIELVGNSLAISDQNESLFSVGRQRIVEQVRDELVTGLIDTGVDPLTGGLK